MTYDAIRAWWNNIESVYQRAFFIGVVVLILGTCGFFGYRWYRSGIQARAQKSFADSADAYKQALSLSLMPQAKEEDKKNQQDLWQEAEIAFNLGYEQNQSSTLAPYFLALQSDALIHQGKDKQAIELLQKAIGLMPAGSIFFYMYSIKLALLEIDQSDTRERGVAQLEKLAQDKQNMFRDFALFQLGSYHLSIDEHDNARDIWRQLVDEYPERNNESSPWAIQAKLKLEMAG